MRAEDKPAIDSEFCPHLAVGSAPRREAEPLLSLLRQRTLSYNRSVSPASPPPPLQGTPIALKNIGAIFMIGGQSSPSPAPVFPTTRSGPMICFWKKISNFHCAAVFCCILPPPCEILHIPFTREVDECPPPQLRRMHCPGVPALFSGLWPLQPFWQLDPSPLIEIPILSPSWLCFPSSQVADWRN